MIKKIRLKVELPWFCIESIEKEAKKRKTCSSQLLEFMLTEALLNAHKELLNNDTFKELIRTQIWNGHQILQTMKKKYLQNQQ